MTFMDRIKKVVPYFTAAERDAAANSDQIMERLEKREAQQMKVADDIFQKIVDQCSETELKVACVLHMLGVDNSSDFGYGNCYFGHDTILSGEGRIMSLSEEVGGKKGLSKVMKELRAFGLATFKSGLMNEDGEVAGSGHAPAPEFEDNLQQLCEQREWL